MPALVLYSPDVLLSSGEGQRVCRLQELVDQAKVPAETISTPLLRKICDTVTPQGIVSVVPFVEQPYPDPAERILIVDRAGDPGNLGTLLRSAEAAGVQLVLLTKGTVDAYNPKVVRAGMGAHFRLPFRVEMSWEAIRTILGERPVFLAEAKAQRAYYEADWTTAHALILGHERFGPSPIACQLATDRIAIPMAGYTESLNVGVAGSIILFEAARQRLVASST